jgi:hypothetical protein
MMAVVLCSSLLAQDRSNSLCFETSENKAPSLQSDLKSVYLLICEQSQLRSRLLICLPMMVGLAQEFKYAPAKMHIHNDYTNPFSLIAGPTLISLDCMRQI